MYFMYDIFYIWRGEIYLILNVKIEMVFIWVDVKVLGSSRFIKLWWYFFLESLVM